MKYLFRGVSIENGKKVFGSLIYDNEKNYIIEYNKFITSNPNHKFKTVEVHYNSISLWSGLYDTNKDMLFENDEVMYYDYLTEKYNIGILKFDNGQFYIDCEYLKSYRLYDYKITKI